jgi:hypothetical protein
VRGRATFVLAPRRQPRNVMSHRHRALRVGHAASEQQGWRAARVTKSSASRATLRFMNGEESARRWREGRGELVRVLRPAGDAAFRYRKGRTSSPSIRRGGRRLITLRLPVSFASLTTLEHGADSV